MEHTISTHNFLAGVGRALEHTAFVLLGLILMIVGLGLGVTMIMLPVGIVVGLLGVAMFVGGIFARVNRS
jgi:membrane-bound ClpP family serine protease